MADPVTTPATPALPEGVPVDALPLANFAKSEVGNILGKLYPGLFEGMAGPDAPIIYDVKIQGAVDTRMVGLETSTPDWFAHPNHAAIVASAENSGVSDAAGYMMAVPAVVVARRGKNVALTNNANLARLNPYAIGNDVAVTEENGSTLWKVDFSNICFDAGRLSEHLDSRGYTSTYADEKYPYTPEESAANGGALEGTRRVETRLHEAVNYHRCLPREADVNNARAFISSKGLPTAMPNEPWLVGCLFNAQYDTLAYPSGLLPVVRNKRYMWVCIDWYGIAGDYVNILNKEVEKARAALKKLDTLTVRNTCNRPMASGGQMLCVIGIPLGDHANTTDLYIRRARNYSPAWKMTDSKQIRHPHYGPTQESGFLGFRYVRDLYELGPGGDPKMLELGLINEEVSSPTNRAAKALGRDKYLMLPLIGVPGNYEFAFDCQVSDVETTIFYTPDGRMIKYRTVLVSAVRACLGIPYQWYQNYLTSGFGLRAPMKDAKLDAALSASEGLAGCVVTCVMYGQGYSIPGDAVTRMPLYADYAKMRSKNCQPNDFMKKKFDADSSRTWGDVNRQVMAAGLTTDLYGLRYHTRTTGEIAGANLAKLRDYRGLTIGGTSVTKDGVITWTIVLTNNGTAPTINPADASEIAEAVAGGAVVNASGIQAINGLFGDGVYNEALTAAGARQVTDASVTGARGTNAAVYDLAWETLSRNGYVLYDEMDESQKYQAAVMSIAEYSKYGRPLRAAWQQFDIPNLIKLLKNYKPKVVTPKA